jgi:hypothetical protein
MPHNYSTVCYASIKSYDFSSKSVHAGNNAEISWYSSPTIAQNPKLHMVMHFVDSQKLNVYAHGTLIKIIGFSICSYRRRRHFYFMYLQLDMKP